MVKIVGIIMSLIAARLFLGELVDAVRSSCRR